MTRTKAYEYFGLAYKDLVKNAGLEAEDKDLACYCMTSLGWNSAAAMVGKMSQEEWDIWIENRELPPWAPEFLRL